MRNRLLLSLLKFILMLIALIPLVLVFRDLAANIKAVSVGGVLADGFFLLGALYLFGGTGSALYAGSFAAGFTDFLFYPRRHLKAPPVITARQKGLISGGKYVQAEQELLLLREQNPAAPEVALLLAELHAVNLNSPEAAVADIRGYLKKRRLRYHPLNLPILLRCADFMQQAGLVREAADLLDRESGSRIYTVRERNVLAERAAACVAAAAESTVKGVSGE